MSNIYETLVIAVRDHWKAHGNQYPQKIVLSTRQHRDLLELRKTGRIALGSDDTPETDRFMGALLEVDDAGDGCIVGEDGSRTPFLAPS